jgi:ribosomal protein S20
VVEQRTERNLLFPSKEFRDRVRLAAKERGFRSEQRLYLRRVRNELARGDSTEATAQLEARIAATLANKGKQGQVHAQITLTNSLLQYVLTCVVEPPEEVLPAARARAKARYAKIHRLAGQEVATRNQATLEEVLTHSKKE